MAIDTSIYGNIKQFQPEQPMNMLAQGLQIQGLQRQNALADAQAQQTQMGLARQNALMQHLQSGADLTTPEGQTDLLRKFPDLAPKLLESQLTLDKTRADTRLANAHAGEFDAASTQKALDAQRGMLTMVRTPQQFAQWVDGMYSNPATAKVAQQFGNPDEVKSRIPTDPVQFNQFLQQNAMGMDKFIQNQTLVRGQDLTAGTARRGQNMTDARSRESTAAAVTKPFEVTGEDGKPVLVQQDKQGNITPVKGYGPKAGASKPLNDSQAKALLFGSRMQEADKLLNDLSSRGTDTPSLTKQIAESVPLIGGALSSAANYAASPDQQSVEQAQRDFVNAVLRRESGAAISPSEFESARKQYFNDRGDSRQVKDQKAANRQLAIRGLLAEVPEGQRGSISTPASAAPAGLPDDIAAILKKHGGK